MSVNNVECYFDNRVCFEFINFYEKHYADSIELTFLDIGCGAEGFFSKFLEEKKQRVVAIDTINELPCTKYILSIKGDVFKIDFVPNSFDCIIDNCCLQLFTLEEVLPLLKKMKAWLKPRGRLYIKTAIESPYYNRVKSRLTIENDLTKIMEGYEGTYHKSTVDLMTGEIVSHYIIDMVKGKE